MFETKFCVAYEVYFGVSIGDQNVVWPPHVSFRSFRFNLEGWLHYTRKKLCVLQILEYGESLLTQWCNKGVETNQIRG